jgi:Ca2+-transporting ATPase
MRLAPRPRHEPVLNQEMLTIIFVIGIVTDVILFVLYLWLLQSGESIESIRTLMFAAVGIDSLLYVFAVKSFRRTLFRINPFSNLWLIAGVGIGFALMALALIHPVVQPIFEIVPLTSSAWGLLVLMGLVKLGAIELTKEFFLVRSLNRQRYVHS